MKNGSRKGEVVMKEKLMRLLSKKLVIGLAAGVVVLGVATGVAVAMLSASPWQRVKESIEKTVAVVKEQSYIVDANDVLDKGSVEIRMNTAELTYGLLNVDVSAKLYSDVKEKACALVAAAAMNGTPFLDASAKLDEKMLVVSSEALLDEVYGMEVQEIPDLKKEFEVFWEASEKQLGKYLVDNVDVEETEGTMSFSTEDVAFDMIAFRADGEKITEFLYNTAVYLKESEEFAQLADAYAMYLETLYAQNAIAAEQTMSRAEIVKAVYDSLDTVINKKEEIQKELGDTTLCVKFSISKEGYLFAIGVEVEKDGDTAVYYVIAGPRPDRLHEINIRAEIGNKVYFLNYAVEEDTEEVFRGNLQFVAGGEVETELQFEKDRANGNFKLQLFEEGEKESSFRVSGTITPEEGGSVIDVEELVVDSVEYNLGIGLTIQKEDSIPELPECTEVLPMEEEAVQRMLEDLTEELGELFSMFL